MNGGRRKVENWNFLCYHSSELLGRNAAAFSRGVARRNVELSGHVFETLFRNFSDRPVCYFLPSRLVKFFDDSGTQIFIWYDVPSGVFSLWTFSEAWALQRATSKQLLSAKFIFHEKVSETAVNPAPLVVSLEECIFISKFSESGES